MEEDASNSSCLWCFFCATQGWQATVCWPWRLLHVWVKHFRPFDGCWKGPWVVVVVMVMTLLRWWFQWLFDFYSTWGDDLFDEHISQTGLKPTSNRSERCWRKNDCVLRYFLQRWAFRCHLKKNEDPSSRKWHSARGPRIFQTDRSRQWSTSCICHRLHLLRRCFIPSGRSFKDRILQIWDEPEMVGVLREEVHAYMPRMKAIHSSLVVV